MICFLLVHYLVDNGSLRCVCSFNRLVGTLVTLLIGYVKGPNALVNVNCWKLWDCHFENWMINTTPKPRRHIDSMTHDHVVWHRCIWHGINWPYNLDHPYISRCAHKPYRMKWAKSRNEWDRWWPNITGLGHLNTKTHMAYKALACILGLTMVFCCYARWKNVYMYPCSNKG